MNEIEIAWLAGLLEGEGTFGTVKMASGRRTVYMAVKMTDRDIIERAANLFGVAVVNHKPGKEGWKPQYRATLRGKRALEVIHQIYPHMGRRRQERMREIIASVESGEVSASGVGKYPRTKK